jgi:beta-glucosidase/6-phospho-beta-glucosidase/beta-galactosidase
LLAEAGYKVIRTDIAWIDVESTKTRGQFDFTNFDNYIFNEMMPRKITPMLILDYNHPLYDNWMSPFTNEGRDAFTRYAMECVKRYNGLGIIWELYNEVCSIGKKTNSCSPIWTCFGDQKQMYKIISNLPHK